MENKNILKQILDTKQKETIGYSVINSLPKRYLFFQDEIFGDGKVT